jgi:ribose transport system permease protein
MGRKKMLRKLNERMTVLKKYVPILALVILSLFFSLLQKRFFTFSNAMIVLQQSVVLICAALGMTFVVVGGSSDFSVGSILALSALGTAMASSVIGVFAFIPGILIGGLCGLINGVIFAKGKVPSFIATMGMMTTYRGIVLLFTKGAPVSINNDLFIDIFAGRTNGIPHSAFFAIVALIIAYVMYNKTVFGREVQAIGGGETVARLSGLKISSIKIKMFIILGFLTGLAGTLQAGRVMAATAQLGQGFELDVIASVVLGGTPLTGGFGTVQGTILGAFIITILSNGMNMIGVDPYMQQIVKGLVMILAVFITIDRKKIGLIK